MWNWVYMSLQYCTSYLCVVVTVITSITSLRLKTICYLNSPQRFPWSAIAGLRCLCGWMGATSLLRFLCGSNSASVAVSALTPIQQSVAAVSRIGNGRLDRFWAWHKGDFTAIGVSAQISCSLDLLLAVARRGSRTSPQTPSTTRVAGRWAFLLHAILWFRA